MTEKYDPFQMIYNSFIDSKMFDDMDARAFKLYVKIRRYVCRSTNHRLAGYWLKGFLATEGYLGTWATWMKCSKPLVSRLLKELEENNVLYCAKKSQRAGQPNIYILGKVIHVEGSERTAELFFLDFHSKAQEESNKIFIDDTGDLDKILAMDVKELPPINFTIHTGEQTVHTHEESIHGGEPSNRKELNKKEVIINNSSFPFSEITEGVVQEPLVNLSYLKPILAEWCGVHLNPSHDQLMDLHNLVEDYGKEKTGDAAKIVYSKWCEGERQDGKKFSVFNTNWIQWLVEYMRFETVRWAETKEIVQSSREGTYV